MNDKHDMTWQGHQTVVTGGCGFIGSHLVERLVARGAEVTALAFYDPRGSNGWLDDLEPDVASQVRIVSGDIRDADQMRRLVPPGATVFHLAALIGIPYSYEAPRSYVDTNVVGTLNLLEASREARRLLVVSTSEVYGSALRVPIDEDHPLQGQSPYSASKIGAEKLAESYYRSFGVPVTVVRPFNTYGPRQSARAVIPTVLMQAAAGRDTIALGDPTTTRDFNFVADTAEAMIRLTECQAAEGMVVNSGTGREVTIGQIVEYAGQLVGRQVRIAREPRRLRPSKSEVRRLCADNYRLRNLTGWIPETELSEGLSQTFAWFKDNISSLDVDRYYL